MKEELEKQTVLLNEIKIKLDEILNVVKRPVRIADVCCHTCKYENEIRRMHCVVCKDHDKWEQQTSLG